MRALGSLVVLAAVTVMLTGCTPALDFGMRLNADDTVDAVICDYSPTQIEVDYIAADDDRAVEWRAFDLSNSRDDDIVRYGDDAFSATVLLPPTPDWVAVSANGAYLERLDLVVGDPVRRA